MITVGKLTRTVKINIEVMTPRRGTKAIIQTDRKNVLMKKERMPIKALPPIQEHYAATKIEELVADEWRVVAYMTRPGIHLGRLEQTFGWKFWMNFEDCFQFRQMRETGDLLTVQKMYPDRALLLAKLTREKNDDTRN